MNSMTLLLSKESEKRLCDIYAKKCFLKFATKSANNFNSVFYCNKDLIPIITKYVSATSEAKPKYKLTIDPSQIPFISKELQNVHIGLSQLRSTNRFNFKFARISAINNNLQQKKLIIQTPGIKIISCTGGNLFQAQDRDADRVNVRLQIGKSFYNCLSSIENQIKEIYPQIPTFRSCLFQSRESTFEMRIKHKINNNFQVLYQDEEFDFEKAMDKGFFKYGDRVIFIIEASSIWSINQSFGVIWTIRLARIISTAKLNYNHFIIKGS